MEDNKQQLFDDNTKLVHLIYNRYYKGFDRWKDDIIQCGFMGLWRAVNAFDPTKNFKFSSYATKCIRVQMMMFIKTELEHYHHNAGEEVSIDGKKVSVYDILSNEDTFENDIDVQLFLQKSKIPNILKMFVNGKNLTDIAKEVGCSRQNIQQHICRERNRLIKEKIEL